MSGARQMQRRAFVVRSLMLAAAGALGPPLAGCGGEAREMTAAELAAWLPGEAAVVRLGREYLEGVPDENEAATLLGLLVADAGNLDDAAARARMLSQIRADYAGGRTVILSGWVLSVSEARLCALAALEAASSPSGT